MDYEEKKAWLRRGIDADKKIQRLSDEIEAERASYVSIKALQYGDMPHSSSGKITDLSDVLTKIEHLFDKLRDELNRQYAIKDEIRAEIERLPNESERSVLYYRYIRGESWERIMQIMHYESSWAHELRKRAIEHLPI